MMSADTKRRSLVGFPLLGFLLRLSGQLLLLLLLLVGFVLGTQTGLRTAIGIAEEFAPEMISVGRAEGRVLGELSIADLTLDLPGLALRLGSLHLDWQPGALLTGKLRVTDLAIADVDVVVEPSDEPPPPKEPAELPEIKLPIGIDIERVLVERLSFSQAGAPPESAIRLTRAELSATALADAVDLRRLMVEMAQPEATANATGNATLSGDYPLNLDLDWRFSQPPALVVEGDGTVSGTLAELLVEHSVSGIAELTLDATLSDVLEEPAWTAEILLEQVDLPAIAPDAPPIDLNASLRSSGNLARAAVTGTLNASAPDLPDVGALSAELDLLWAEQRLTLNRVGLDETQSGGTLELTGFLDLSEGEPAFDIEGAWERLRWPLTGVAVVDAPLGRLDVKGDLEAFDYSLAAEVFGEQIPETEMTLTGTASAEATEIEELLVETLDGRIEVRGNVAWAPAVTWDIAVNASDLDPGAQWAGLDGLVTLKADSGGGLEDGYRFDANLNADVAAYPGLVLNVAGEGDLTKASLTKLSVETLAGLIDGGGEVAWDPTLTWDFALTANDLNPGDHYEGLDGRIGFKLSTSGGLEDGFAYLLQGSAAVADYPPATVDVSGLGTAEATELERFAVEVLDGRIDGAGRVAWAPELSWDTRLRLSDLNPGSLAADWPGELGGRVETVGKLTDAGPELTADIVEFGGDLRGYPVRLGADLAMSGETIRLTELTAGSGATELDAEGVIDGEKLDLRFDFDSPDLATLIPGGGGSLAADGLVAGSLTAPRIQARLRARDAEVSGQGIEQLDGNLDIGLGENGRLDIDLDGANLIAGGMRFETLSVRGTGSMPNHRLTASIDGEPLGLELALEGGLADAGAYTGRLAALSLATEEFGTWALQRPAELAFADGAAKLGPLCIGNGQNSGGCVSFDQPRAGLFEASLDVERIGFEILNPVLPELLVMDGFLRAKGRFRGEGTRLVGDATVEIPDGAIEMSLGEADDKLVFSSARVNLRSDAQGLGAALSLPLEGLGGIDADLSLPGFVLDSGPAQPLRGRVQLRLDGLSRISNLLPDIDDVNGNIDADLALGGTLGQPDIRTDLRVQDLGLSVPLFGFELSETNLTATSAGPSALTLDGGGSIGGGGFEVGGDINLAGEVPVAQISLRGDQLKVADSSEYFALVSLDMEVGTGAAGTAVRGEIDVPEARIKPRAVPTGSVQPSSDITVEEPEDAEGPPLSIDLLVKLGEAVSIDAFGLRGLLRGELNVLKAPQGEILGDGKLQVVDGTFRVSLPTLGVMTAIGKPLTIRQGIVTFAKTPIGNPGLILDAQRDGGDVTAGVRVLGTVRDPKLAFFSESDPNLSQAEITRYLVTGIPPSRDGDGEEQALAVGTYVAPKLYVEYESATTDAQDTVKMRYDLNSWIELQTETGDTQGADVFFKFEN